MAVRDPESQQIKAIRSALSTLNAREHDEYRPRRTAVVS